MKEQDKRKLIFTWIYLHVMCGMEGIFIWNYKSKFYVEKKLALNERTVHQSKKCIVKRNLSFNSLSSVLTMA